MLFGSVVLKVLPCGQQLWHSGRAHASKSRDHGFIPTGCWASFLYSSFLHFRCVSLVEVLSCVAGGQTVTNVLGTNINKTKWHLKPDRLSPASPHILSREKRQKQNKLPPPSSSTSERKGERAICKLNFQTNSCRKRFSNVGTSAQFLGQNIKVLR